ncbi:alkaline phosphatase [uncultured Corynebacterium sp.]|uniref:alkaline phosphatase n=1 Tax=uncultured Corynebacterium sp. TaxID=159447 RepID=UPI0025F06B79|nr:alkaline phosphatase [uncultured Corynebacterium sp.]
MRISSRALRAALVATTVAASAAVAPVASAADKAPKSIIYMIGDGMGYGHIANTNLFESGQSKYLVEGAFGKDTAKELDGKAVQKFEDFNRLSMATHSANSGTFDPEKAWTDHEYFKSGATDSAAAGTAMATGVKVNNGVLGVSEYGHPMENISERAIREGKAAGVVTSVEFNHATPAAFAAHNKNRNNFLEIGQSMIDSDLTVVMGTGHPEYDDNAKKVEESEYNYDYISKENLAAMRAGSLGWEFTDNSADFEKWANGEVEANKKYFGLAPVHTTLQQNRDGATNGDYPTNAMPGTDPKNDVVDLPTMTKAALNILSKDEDGFSVMIEGGAIDWSGHADQTARNIEEVQDFNKSVEAVIDWVENNSSWDETLVIVTADHETGFLSGVDEDKTWNAMTGEQGKAPNVQWYSNEHTNQVVPFFFKGAGSEDIKAKVVGKDYVRGDFIDNTAVAKLIFDEWWFNTSGNDDDNKGDDNKGGDNKGDNNADDNKDDSKKESGSSNGIGAGFIGAGIMAAIAGAIAAIAQALGVLKIDLSALTKGVKF